jgi:RHS repeat-associated protein
MLGGNPTSSAPAATNLLYTGEQFDTDAQQYYLRARYYNPLNGRFNRMDPYAGNTHDPQSLHKYLYCHANPINRLDPTGYFSLLSTSVSAVLITVMLSTNYANAPVQGGPEYADATSDMILNLFIGIALLPVAIVGGRIVSGVKYKYLKWRGKSTTVIYTSTGKVGIPGKKIGDATFVNPGPLADDVASTFSGGRYAIVKTEEPVQLYRVWGGEAAEFGGYWSTTPPSGSLASQIDNALVPTWGNTASKWTTIEVPKGTTLFVGEAASQGGIFVGGGSQVFVGTEVTAAMKIAGGSL